MLLSESFPSHEEHKDGSVRAQRPNDIVSLTSQLLEEISSMQRE